LKRLDLMKSRHHAELKRAIKDAFATLTSNQRNMLRLYFIDGLTGEKIGEILRVHRTKVVRSLAAAREDVLAKTKQLLRERLRLRNEEVDGLIAELQSQFDVSVTALLRETQP
jgi:RNA polymerase sigma-70 factor (ECF subfamily)